jgi:hypothetical protein
MVPENYTRENLRVLGDMEKALREALNLIEQIKQSQNLKNNP